MKIAAKIAAGYMTLIALIVGVLAYQLTLFYQMQSINQELSGINFRAAILSLQLLRDLEPVEEFTRKFYATGGDPDYASRMKEMRNAFSQDLRELEFLPVSAAEKQEVDRLSLLWKELSQVSASREQISGPISIPQTEAALSDQLALLSRLGTQAQSVIRAARLAIESRVEESSRAGKHAQRISWIAAAAALALSLVVSFWIIRSISRPLRYLTEGTRAVAEGKFFYQLDATGGDELAQLAGDFNRMTRRLSELDEMKKDFVSHVSHELKTPLASMQEGVRLLLDGIPGPLNEQQKRYLELNLQSSRRLSALIGNLLDLSRMEAGVMQYDIQRHDLGALIRTVLEEFEAPLREKSLRLEVQLPGPICWKENWSLKIINGLIRVGEFVSRGKWEFQKIRQDACNAAKVFHSSMKDLLRNPKKLVIPTFYLILNWIASMSIPYLVFLSLGFNVSWGAILVTTSIVIAVKSIPVGIPFEVGLPEIAMTTLYASVGIPPEIAATSTILSRIITLWLRFGVGFAAYQWTEIKAVSSNSGRK